MPTTPADDQFDEATAGPRSRRRFLRTASLGIGALVLGTAGGAGAMRYRDIAAARTRGDGATNTVLSQASNVEILWRAQTDRKVMALTFDDGPGEELTKPLLAALRAEKVRATSWSWEHRPKSSRRSSRSRSAMATSSPTTPGATRT